MVTHIKANFISFYCSNESTATVCLMFFVLFFFVSSEEESECNFTGKALNCLNCVDHGCQYCRDESTNKYLCISVNSTIAKECKDFSTTRDSKCVAELGYDAIPKNRYIIGVCFIVLALAVDLSVRFCSKPKVNNEWRVQ